ncbi:MAG: M48 family metallopeptidase [Flavobacteriales bacterium]
MPEPSSIELYDGLSTRPATFAWHGPTILEVRVGNETHQWNVQDKQFRWDLGEHHLRLSHGVRALIVKDATAQRLMSAHLKQYAGRRKTSGAGPILFSRAMFLFLIIVGGLVAAYIWLMPIVAEHLALRLPRSVDDKIGEASFDAMAPTMVFDTARTAALQQFGDALEISRDHALKYHVCTDAQVNAFAMPGGHIVVYTGLLNELDTPQELAGLLAHEGTHVQERHSTRSLVRQFASSFFISLIAGDAGALGEIAANKGDELRGLGYSRDLEQAADDIGMQRMYANGVDPHGMIDLLEELKGAHGADAEPPAFLSSHPLTDERIANATARSSALGVPSHTRPEFDTLFAAVRK